MKKIFRIRKIMKKYRIYKKLYIEQVEKNLELKSKIRRLEKHLKNKGEIK